MSEIFDILLRMKQNMSSFSKGQRAIARYIISNYDKASYMTAATLGKHAGVSESTVIRFVNELGFVGYQDFQDALAEYVHKRLKTARKLDFALDTMDPDEIADFVMENDMENIKEARKNMDLYAINEAVTMICKAANIYIIGIQNCSALAELLTMNLKMFFHNVINVIHADSDGIFREILDVTDKDVVIGISYPRYSIRTIKALEYANDCNARIITMTDQKHSPLCLYSACNILAPSNMSSIVDSYAAVVSVINVLMVSLYMEKKENVLEHMERYEKVRRDYSNDELDELDYFDSDKIKDFSR